MQPAVPRLPLEYQAEEQKTDHQHPRVDQHPPPSQRAAGADRGEGVQDQEQVQWIAGNILVHVERLDAELLTLRRRPLLPRGARVARVYPDERVCPVYPLRELLTDLRSDLL